MDYRKVLLAVCPHGKKEILDGMAATMPQIADYAELSTARRLGVFIGQCAEESDHFKTVREYASGKEYEGRTDLGNTRPGWGVRYKGRGAIQLTGYDNYAKCGRDLGVDLVGQPEQVERFPLAGMAAGWFWKKNKINDLADNPDPTVAIKLTTRKINGGYNGLAERTRLIKLAWSAIADLKGTLTAVAKQETAKAQTKTMTAAASAATSIPTVSQGVKPDAATHAAVGAYGEWGLIVLGVLLAAGAVALAITISKHLNAAKALTQAAQEA